MFIGINNLVKAKRLLKEEFLNNLYESDENNKKFVIDKYKHSYDCLAILRTIMPTRYLRYSTAVLLHDIGRFSEYKNLSNFEHAEYGYKLLKNKFTSDPLILLPVKYHENDLEWKTEIIKNPYYLNSNKKTRKQIIQCCCIVRDVDIISNMKLLLNNDMTSKGCQKINNELITLLKNKQIGKIELINCDCDKIVYLLCGLALVYFEVSFKYLKQARIIEKLIDKIEKNSSKDVTSEIRKIILENYNL